MFSPFSLSVVRWICAIGLTIGAPSVVVALPSNEIPGPQPILRNPISPEDAEKLNSKRRDHLGQNTGIGAELGKIGSASALAAPAAPIPTSVAELARALKYDPVLIYEFVHNNIEYIPIWSVLKGSEGTLTDGAGTAFDIAQLTAELINTNSAPGTSATLVRGTVRISGANAASWIRLNGMNICPLASTFAAGGIPTTFAVTGYPNCTGGGTSVTIGHVWVKVVIGGITYEIDPSFKTHTAVSPSVNLATVTGYSRSSFLAAACTSCNTNPNIVTTLNRASILNPANTHSYPKYARNLLSYLQANNIHDLSQVIGGYKIDQTYHTSLPAFPNTIISRSADPFTIDGTWKPSLLVNFNGISQLFSSDALYGKRLTVTFNGSNFPQLNLDGTVVQTGTTAVAPGTDASVNLSICMPDTGVNCSVATVDGSGKALWCSNPSPVRCVSASIRSGGTYAITNSWGPVSNNMVARHRIASIRATNAGIAPTAEANLGEALTTLGFSYAEQDTLYLSLSEDGRRNGGFLYYNVGIAGHTGGSGGPYIDLPGSITFPGMSEQLNGNGTYTSALRNDNFIDSAVTHGSVLESTSVNQISGVPSVSTAKLMDIGISQATNNNVYDLKTCSDYTTYNGSLVSYDAGVKASVQDLVCNKSYRVILPQRGNLTDPAITTTPKWTGAGYYGFPNSGAGSYPSIIWGGYAGGYAGAPQSQTDTVVNANVVGNKDIIVTARNAIRVDVDRCTSNCRSYAEDMIVRDVTPRWFSDPVDQVSGAFLKTASDISVGEKGSARILSFDRSYTTADITASSPVGQGWKHNLDIWLQTTSDGVRPAGVYDAWDAAEMLVVKMVNRDLMSDPLLPAVNIAVAAIGTRWLGDRLVNNIVTANTGTTAFNFQRVADDSFNPSQRSKARLTGGLSAWFLTDSDGAQMAFNPASGSGLAQVGSITQPNGIKTTFTYSSGLLTQVSNNLGRRLDLNWSSGKIASVTDTPLLGASTRTVTFAYNSNLLQQVTDTQGGRTLYCYDGAGRMTAYFLPSEGSGTNCGAPGAHMTNVYDTLGRVKQQVDGGGHVTDLYLAGTRGEAVTHPGSGVSDIRQIRYMDDFGNTIREVNPRTGLPTKYTFDALSRLVRIDYAEGNAVELAYDMRSNLTQTCSIPKTAAAYPACSGSIDALKIVTAYNEGAVWNCTAINTCNRPASVTDPLGNVTNYTYYSDGQVDTVTSPTPSGYTGAPKTKNTYTATASLSGNINLLTQTQWTATAGSPPSIVTMFGYDTAANGLVLKTSTLDPSGLNYVTSYGYDGYGNQITVKGPRTDLDDTVTTSYNTDRNPVTVTYPLVGASAPITQITYNGDGRVTTTARKLGSSWMVTCISYTPSGQIATAFGPYKTASATDCSFGGNQTVALTRYGYDGADRLITTTIADPLGDRVTKLGRFPDNLVQTVTRAFGTALAATETTAYSNNGFPTSVTDARGNISGTVYDGFDRISQMKYPLAAGGGPSGSDLVAFAYDKRNALIKQSIRGNSDVSASCTQCISFTYDELGRLKQKTVPTMAANTSVTPNVASVAGYSVFYHYDLIGRLDSQGYTSGSPELTFAYDNASRLSSATQYSRTVSYSYGTPSQGLARTMTWPSSAGTMLTCTDALARVSQIKDSSNCATTTGRLVAYSYDDLSRQVAITRGNGVVTSYTYDNAGSLDTLAQVLGGTGSISYGFDYNRVRQITNRTADNGLYLWANYDPNQSYTRNGLDQYTAINASARQWDARGNFLFDGSWSYGYDGENRLARVAMPSSAVTTNYDPADRLRQTGAVATTQFLYDGSALIAEYNASGGALLARYVPGAGVDETAVAYDGSGTKSWYHADAQGSVVAATDATGAATVINQYGPFGEPGAASSGRNAGRIRFTGQRFIPELGLYDYKARIYSSKLGRFIQTDPIGAADDRNLYAYVGNDPINRTDPAGLFADRASQIAGDVIGKIRAAPVSAVGIAIGSVDLSIKILSGDFDSISVGAANNAIQFKNVGLGVTEPFTLGNTQIYPPGYGPDRFTGGYDNAMPTNTGRHEEGHTYQYQALGGEFIGSYLSGGLQNAENPYEKAADRYARGLGPPYVDSDEVP